MISLVENNSSTRKNILFSGYVVICSFLSMIVFSVDLLLPLGIAGGVPYIAMVLISLRSKKIKFTLFCAIACSILTLLGWFFSPEGGELWKVATNRFLALFAIWVTTLLSVRINEGEKEIKTLRGFLPICASCKKIKDEEGSWSELESYIHHHTEAKFSHGMCPDCFSKSYPNYEYPPVTNSKSNQ